MLLALVFGEIRKGMIAELQADNGRAHVLI